MTVWVRLRVQVRVRLRVQVRVQGRCDPGCPSMTYIPILGIPAVPNLFCITASEL